MELSKSTRRLENQAGKLDRNRNKCYSTIREQQWKRRLSPPFPHLAQDSPSQGGESCSVTQYMAEDRIRQNEFPGGFTIVFLKTQDGAFLGIR